MRLHTYRWLTCWSLFAFCSVILHATELTAPTLIWPTPATLTYGMPLTSQMLNATANVGGTFIYPALLSPTIPRNFRYWRFVMNQDATNGLLVWHEVRFFSGANQTGSQLTVVQASSSALTEVGGPPSLLIDGITTESQSRGSFCGLRNPLPGSFFQFDLGSPLTIGSIAVYHYRSLFSVDSVHIEGSLDGITWMRIASDVPLQNVTRPSEINLGVASHVTPIAGTHTLTLEFIPTDTEAYSTTTTTVDVTVLPAVPVISWSTPESIGEGTALSEAQLNASADVPGSFVYSDATGSILSVGTHLITVTFTPSDIMNYTVSTASIQLTVNHLTDPGLIWPTPADIPYGTPLSPNVLNASAAVPGSFSYSSNLSSLLPRDFRYWRTVMVGNGPNSSMIWNEVQFYSGNHGSGVQYAVQSATSSHPFINAPPSRLIDGALAESQGFGEFAQLNNPLAGKYFQFDLGSTKTVGSIVIYAYRPSLYVEAIHIEASADGISWLRVADNFPLQHVTRPAYIDLNAPTTTLLDAATYTLQVQFIPDNLTAYLTKTISVPLTIIQAQPLITWDSPAAITDTTPLSSTQLNASVNVPGIISYNPPLGTMLAPGVHTVTAAFTPNDTLNYTTATTSVLVTVRSSIPPEIIWPTPSPITFGTRLSLIQLNAISPIAGSFIYTPALETLLETGDHVLTATFIPNVATVFLSVSTNVNIHVSPAVPEITWATPDPMYFGTALSVLQLNALASVAGTFAYTPELGEVLFAGSQIVNVIFTPEDTVNYTQSTSSVVIEVQKATPVIEWQSLPPLTYGESLSQIQCNALSNVPGDFVYHFSLGTILTAGPHTLSLTFTPSDVANYTPVSIDNDLLILPSTPMITWAEPDPITYGTALSELQLNASTSVPGSFIYTPELGTILNAGSKILHVTFSPDDTQNYSPSSTSVQLTISTGTPFITWNAPPTMTYGMLLSERELNASATIPGTFHYNPAADTMLDAGVHTLAMTFTPTDSDNYEASTTHIDITVDRANPSITWQTPEPIDYGVVLSASQLNASANIPGTYTYNPILGTVLHAGTHTLDVHFTPQDLLNYSSIAAQVNLVVGQRASALTWNIPSPITYGTALSSTQLNATASVPGSFTYNPPLDTILNAGVHTLSVTWIPTDQVNYIIQSAQVPLTITKAVPNITWPTPAAINVGTALSLNQLNASSTLPGTFIFSPSAGTILPAGSNILNAVFTPTDAVNYSTTSASVTLTVNNLMVTAALVSETFNYPAGSISGKNGGTGWSNAWTFTGTKKYRTDSIGIGAILDYPNLTESGNYLKWWTATGSSPLSLSRSFTKPITDDGQTYWMAFELQTSYQKISTGFNLNGYTTSPLISIVAATPAPSITFLGNTTILLKSAAAHLFVFKFVMSGTKKNADDTVTVYVDPNLAGDASLWRSTATKKINLMNGFTGITLTSNRNSNASSVAKFDEFRIGTTWQSAVGLVAPINIAFQQTAYAPIMGFWMMASHDHRAPQPFAPSLFNN